MSLFCRCIAVLFVLVLSGPGHSQDSDSDEEIGLKYRLLGPVNGGRASRVVGVPGDPLIYYLSIAAGGVWKSSNGGMSWESLRLNMPTVAIADLAVAINSLANELGVNYVVN